MANLNKIGAGPTGGIRELLTTAYKQMSKRLVITVLLGWFKSKFYKDYDSKHGTKNLCF